jgi:hypothetical protein
MSFEHLNSYITYLSEFKVVNCRFCEGCIPPNNPVRHYELNHTAKNVHYVPTNIRHQVRDYMATLNLCEPDKVISPNRLVPGLKIIKKGFVCKFAGCGDCRTSEAGMRTHYYSHREHIPKDFKDWESTGLQTFFDGHHKK